MSAKSIFMNNISTLLFLEIKKDKLQNLVSIQENLHVPIKSQEIIDRIKNGHSVEELPFKFFIEGMVYVLGADESFRLNKYYKSIIKKIPESVNFIKASIFNEIKKKNYIDAYIMLKGLMEVETTSENFDKLLSIIDFMRINYKDYKKEYREEELSMIDRAKEVEGCISAYLYESLVNKDDGDFEKALFSLNTYLAKGGEETETIKELKHKFKNINNYEKGKEILYDEPIEALKLLIPLIEEYSDDPSLYYYIAVGYRLIKNYEKAIYYLNEALSLDKDFVDVVNELGINCASLGDYNNAILYFKKAFEATKALEICTNIIMCYINIGDMDSAKLHLNIAKAIDAEDEIVKKLQTMIEQ